MGKFAKMIVALTVSGAISWGVGTFVFIPGTFTPNAQFAQGVEENVSHVREFFSPKKVSIPPISLAPSPEETPVPATLSQFASCLTSYGLKMYGTKTCPNCKAQKELFGDGVDKLTLIDCDDQAALCTEKKIRGYPTWEFPDGRMVSGVVPLEYFSQQTGCVLPAK